MKLLITGGTGFIGSRLALAARASGQETVVAGQVNSEPERARLRELEAAGVVVEQGPLQRADYARRISTRLRARHSLGRGSARGQRAG